jgi:hypothetical protein
MKQYKDLKSEKIKELAYKVTIAENGDELDDAVWVLVETNNRFQKLEERLKREWRCLTVFGDLTADRVDDVYPKLVFSPDAVKDGIDSTDSIMANEDYEPCYGDTCEDTGETVDQWLIGEAELQGILT